MQTIQTELNRIKKFIEKSIIEHKYLMPREPEEGEDTSCLELVNPKVVIGSLPHSNFSMYGANELRFSEAPYFLIGFDTASFEDDSENIQILIQACAYTCDNYTISEDGLVYPDNMGILDSTSMIESLISWMDKAKFPIKKPITIGTYATQSYTYPYSYSYMQFELATTVGRPVKKFDFI